MKKKWSTAVTLVLVASFLNLSAFSLKAMADTNARLTEMENLVFRNNFNGEKQISRLERIEKVVYGKSQIQTIDRRVANLSNLLQVDSNQFAGLTTLQRMRLMEKSSILPPSKFIPMKPQNLLFLVDCSKSMKEGFGELTKIETVKCALEHSLGLIKPGVKVGIRTFGESENEKIVGIRSSLPQSIEFACRQTRLRSPFLLLNKEILKKEISELKPSGESPLTYTLKTALRSELASLEEPTLVMLLCDSSDSCSENPAYPLLQIPSSKIQIAVISLGHFEKEEQLIAISNNRGGLYSRIDTLQELQESLWKDFFQYQLLPPAQVKGDPHQGSH